ncbi:MFS transporter [Coxiella burnetii]|uniref:MFS transporter n=1 Tax=Coxiella burnetii TaxID=777 RepID=UPI0022323112|nr:MFS transporter [Coxiella burnetii]
MNQSNERKKSRIPLRFIRTTLKKDCYLNFMFFKKLKTKKTGVIAWAFYDWANSSFSSIILTFVFAAYFTEKVAVNRILGTTQWSYAVAIAGFMVALLSPFFGAIADHEGRRKPWVMLFALLSIFSAGLLWFAKPDPAYVAWSLIWLILGEVGLEVSMVFYNAMLGDLAPSHYWGRVSGWAWGLGYFGGLFSLIITLFLFVPGHVAWLNKGEAEQIRIVGPFVASWYFIFSLPFVFLTPDRPTKGITYRKAIRLGVKQLWQTLRRLPKYKEVFKFLIARMIYIDGLNTIFAFGGIYAAGAFNMTFGQVIQFGIALNIAAGLGAIGFAWLDDYVGAKPTVLISLVIMLIGGIGMVLVKSQLAFWVLGMLLSIAVGPVQAASRSLMVRLAPAHVRTEMFGLYAFSGKATAFVGPWLVGAFTFAFDSQRIGMSTVLWFLLIGGVLLFFVKVPKKQRRLKGKEIILTSM